MLLNQRAALAESLKQRIAEGEGLHKTTCDELSARKKWDEWLMAYRCWAKSAQDLIDTAGSQGVVIRDSDHPPAGECEQDFSRNSFQKNRRAIRDGLVALQIVQRRVEVKSEALDQALTVPGESGTEQRTRVFLVHGHDNELKETVARFLEHLLLSVVILFELPDRFETIIEKFEQYSNVAYAVILLTPDDVGSARRGGKSKPRARQNVILELGYFLGALGRSRVCALVDGQVELPSDLAGILTIGVDPHGAWKMRLATELRAAGIDVDLNLVAG